MNRTDNQTRTGTDFRYIFVCFLKDRFHILNPQDHSERVVFFMKDYMLMINLNTVLTMHITRRHRCLRGHDLRRIVNATALWRTLRTFH